MTTILGPDSQISLFPYPERCIDRVLGSLGTIATQALLIHNRPMLVKVKLDLGIVLVRQLEHGLLSRLCNRSSLIRDCHCFLQVDCSVCIVAEQSIFTTSNSAQTVE
jgi:hypothetical protein